MSSIENFQLHLSSNFADKIYSNNNADTEFYLPLIEIPSQYHLHVNVVHASIPFTFYNINSSNNVLHYETSLEVKSSYIIYSDLFSVVSSTIIILDWDFLNSISSNGVLVSNSCLTDSIILSNPGIFS